MTFVELGESITAYGQLTGPAADTPIASVISPSGGVYAIDVHPVLSGVVGPAELDNFTLKVGSTFHRIACAGLTSIAIPTFSARGIVNGLQNIAVRSVNAGTVTAVYSVSLTISRME